MPWLILDDLARKAEDIVEQELATQALECWWDHLVKFSRSDGADGVALEISDLFRSNEGFQKAAMLVNSMNSVKVPYALSLARELLRKFLHNSLGTNTHTKGQGVAMDVFAYLCPHGTDPTTVQPGPLIDDHIASLMRPSKLHFTYSKTGAYGPAIEWMPKDKNEDPLGEDYLAFLPG